MRWGLYTGWVGKTGRQVSECVLVDEQNGAFPLPVAGERQGTGMPRGMYGREVQWRGCMGAFLGFCGPGGEWGGMAVATAVRVCLCCRREGKRTKVWRTKCDEGLEARSFGHKCLPCHSHNPACNR